VAIQKRTFKVIYGENEKHRIAELDNLEKLDTTMVDKLKCQNCRQLAKLVSLSDEKLQEVRCAECQTLANFKVSSTIVDVILPKGVLSTIITAD
jgi:hypothetical protein